MHSMHVVLNVNSNNDGGQTSCNGVGGAFDDLVPNMSDESEDQGGVKGQRVLCF